MSADSDRTNRTELAASTGDLPTEAFRKYDHEMIDWIAEYLEDPTQYPVLSQSHPSFFAYFAISSSVPGILGELLAAAPDTNAMMSPYCAFTVQSRHTRPWALKLLRHAAEAGTGSDQE